MARIDEGARGVYIISVTPFDDRGAIDYASADRLVDFYVERGVDGITILGMMGEAPKLTSAESLAFAEHMIKRAGDRLPVVVGVSNPGLAPMRELADGVMLAGAAGVMVAPPSSLKTDGDILRYYMNVASELGPQTPIVIQDFPLASGVTMSVDVILRIIATLPSCVMLKHEDWPGLAKIGAIRAASEKGDVRRVSILAGNGGVFLAEELMRGADGAMTGFAYPEMLVDVCRAHGAGQIERAFDIFDAYLPLARYEGQPGLGLAVRKHVLCKRGIIRCAAIRKPGPTLQASDVADIERLIARQTRRLQEIG